MKYKHCIRLVDFNISLLHVNRISSLFKDTILQLGLQIVQFNGTHHTLNCNTWLDLVIADNINNVISSGQSSEPFLSNHDEIYIKYKYKIEQRKKNYYLSKLVISGYVCYQRGSYENEFECL